MKIIKKLTTLCCSNLVSGAIYLDIYVSLSKRFLMINPNRSLSLTFVFIFVQMKLHIFVLNSFFVQMAIEIIQFYIAKCLRKTELATLSYLLWWVLSRNICSCYLCLLCLCSLLHWEKLKHLFKLVITFLSLSLLPREREREREREINSLGLSPPFASVSFSCLSLTDPTLMLGTTNLLAEGDSSWQ